MVSSCPNNGILVEWSSFDRSSCSWKVAEPAVANQLITLTDGSCMLTQTLAPWRRLAHRKWWMTSLVGIIAIGPVQAVAASLDCRFTRTCRGVTCQELDNATLHLGMFELGDGSNPLVMSLADARLLEGPPLDESMDHTVIFPTYEAGAPSVQTFGQWINYDDDPRRDIIIAFDDGARLTIVPSDVDGAVLTKEGRGLKALFGSSQAIGRCESVDVAQ